MRVLVVGAGLAGLTAGVLLNRKGHDVRVLETRTHVGGNCWDYLYNGVHVHRYGPHIFHTNDQRVYKFFTEFCTLTNYRHEVKANIQVFGAGGTTTERLVSIPYSLQTQAELGFDMTDEEIVQTFFRAYSEKMWGRKYAEIPAAITGRVPKRRTDTNTKYFTDLYQGMPADGYSALFTAMSDCIGRNNIEFGVGAHAWRGFSDEVDLVVYTGMLDSFYELEHGYLPYRAIQFEFRHGKPVSKYSVVNWCDDRPCTRSTDYSRFYPAKEVAATTIGAEYPFDWDPHSDLVPSYPMRGFAHADEIMARYDALSPGTKVVFAGRLGSYRYMNMDAVIADVMFKLESKLGESMYA